MCDSFCKPILDAGNNSAHPCPMILSPKELEAMRHARLASSERASRMTSAEVVAQVSASGCEWKLNPQWNGRPHPAGDRVIPRIRLVRVG